MCEVNIVEGIIVAVYVTVCTVQLSLFGLELASDVQCDLLCDFAV